VAFARSPNCRREVGHRLAIGHSVPALGQGRRLGFRLSLITNHDSRTSGVGLIEVKHVSNQFLLRGHGIKGTARRLGSRKPNAGGNDTCESVKHIV